MSNLVKEEFDRLMGHMFGGQNISDGQRKDMERSFYAGAMAVNIAILKSPESKSPEENIGEVFDFINKKCQELTEE